MKISSKANKSFEMFKIFPHQTDLSWLH